MRSLVNIYPALLKVACLASEVRGIRIEAEVVQSKTVLLLFYASKPTDRKPETGVTSSSRV